MKISRKQIYVFSGTLILFILLKPGHQIHKLSPLTSESVVVAFGDSLTYGTGADSENSYPTLLSNSYPDTKFINAGIPGELSAAGLVRLPDVLAKEQPNLVLLCHGGNDILKGLSSVELKSNLREMVRLIRDSDSEVLLVSVPQKGILLSSLPLYQALADELEIPCEDEILASVLSKGYLKSDYVHPNKTGYKKIAKAIEELIRVSSE